MKQEVWKAGLHHNVATNFPSRLSIRKNLCTLFCIFSAISKPDTRLKKIQQDVKNKYVRKYLFVNPRQPSRIVCMVHSFANVCDVLCFDIISDNFSNGFKYHLFVAMNLFSLSWIYFRIRSRLDYLFSHHKSLRLCRSIFTWNRCPWQSSVV